VALGREEAGRKGKQNVNFNLLPLIPAFASTNRPPPFFREPKVRHLSPPSPRHHATLRCPPQHTVWPDKEAGAEGTARERPRKSREAHLSASASPGPRPRTFARLPPLFTPAGPLPGQARPSPTSVPPQKPNLPSPFHPAFPSLGQDKAKKTNAFLLVRPHRGRRCVLAILNARG